MVPVRRSGHPIPEKCNGLDDDCDGAPEAPGCVPCTAGTGSCNGTLGQYCGSGLGYTYENCDPLEGMSCNPQTGQCVGVCTQASLGSSYLGCDYFPTVTANLVDPQFHFAVSQSDPNDVTGTLVKATKPVQVIGGHQCIYIPDTTGYCDHLEESMLPLEALSTSYIVTAPLIPTSPATTKVEYVRIIATKANTGISYDPPQPGAPSFLAQAGQWAEIAGTTADFQIKSTDPVLVATYFAGQDAGGNIGDPSLSIAIPSAQSLAGIRRPDSSLVSGGSAPSRCRK